VVGVLIGSGVVRCFGAEGESAFVCVCFVILDFGKCCLDCSVWGVCHGYITNLQRCLLVIPYYTLHWTLGYGCMDAVSVRYGTG